MVKREQRGMRVPVKKEEKGRMIEEKISARKRASEGEERERGRERSAYRSNQV